LGRFTPLGLNAMKRYLSIIKTICFITLIIPATSSFAQNLISNLKDGETVQAINQNYQTKKIKKSILIENINNKFTNIKQNSPNVYHHRPGYPHIVVDEAKLSRICAKYISKQQIETLAASDENAGLMFSIRTDIYGKTLEIAFFTEQNSILSLQQLEQIENEVRIAKLVHIEPKVLYQLEGSNYWKVRPLIYYDDLLKVKQGMERPQQREIH
jgi:hypothetical protein